MLGDENGGNPPNTPVDRKDSTGATELVDAPGCRGLPALVNGTDLPSELKIGDFAGETVAAVDDGRGLMDEQVVIAEVDVPKMLNCGNAEIFCPPRPLPIPGCKPPREGIP